jgi:type IV secretory pathway VirB4 component
MFTIREFRKEPDRLADFLPWAALVAPGVVLNKEGSFQMTYKYRGPDLESSTDSELIIISERINNALKRLGSSWSIFFEAQRRRSRSYPLSEFPCTVSAKIDQERRELFEMEGEHYESEYYVTFVFLPPSDRVNRIVPLFIENTSKKCLNYSECLSTFIDDVEGIVEIIKGAIPNIRRLSDDETLTYLHSTISTKYHQVKSPHIPLYLDAILPDEPLTPGLEPKLGDSFLQIVCLRSFPGESFPVLFDDLNNLHMPYRWTSRFICLSKESAIRELKKYKRQWYAKRKTLETLIKDVFSKDSDSESIMIDTDAKNKAGDSDRALQEVSDDRVAYGFYTLTVIVSDRDKARAEEKIKAVESVINGLGFTTIREGVNAVEAWLGSLPGHVHANVRRPLGS